VTTSPCECGDPRLRFKIIGRADDMLIVKGVNVYPAALKNSISKFVPRVSGDFRILLDAPPPSVKPPLKMQIELGQDQSPEEIEQLRNDIRADMHTDLRVTPSIDFVPPNTFEKATHKGKVFMKRYEEKPSDKDVVEVHNLKQS